MESIDYTKRFLLKGKTSHSLNHEIRPPWHASQEQFQSLCTRCNLCLSTCPENIITKAISGFPAIDFTLGECTFCQACVEACPSQALALENSPEAFKQLEIEIDSRCLNLKGCICQSCCDSCDTQALKLNWHSAIPCIEIDNDACTFCGACVSSCPVGAIEISTVTKEVAYRV